MHLVWRICIKCITQLVWLIYNFGCTLFFCDEIKLWYIMLLRHGNVCSASNMCSAISCLVWFKDPRMFFECHNFLSFELDTQHQANPYGKITLNPHVAHMCRTCVHMWPICAIAISHFCPHVRKFFHMWDTCEVRQTHVDIVCLTCDTHEPHMWPHVGLMWAPIS